MIRACLALSAAATLTVAGTAVAHAQPVPPCTYSLSAPVVVDNSVAATVAPAECAWPAAPGFSVACLQLSGTASPTTCMQSHGRDSAQVLLAPYVPGASYTATGRGCGRWVGQPPAHLCQQLGPVSATL
ncbi:hypothetical protein AU196_06530 [Mycobacterium sp. IS-1742]|uniref:hypothetical protein n=1 Tax=Mycobacterium sp. IS-1742 TaxID=1772285 RepID=UPI0007403200|nr:hypothetical protein [Mycobacterium sp. IS-1742]KUI24951.1 hypothetical protein AU196_06530 [Mycobacterium sp. IS-1742]